MIALLRGKATALHENTLIVDVNGVGYEVTCSELTKFDLLEKEYCKVLIHTHVREDAIVLFGFSTPIEKQMFLSLVKVNGIGPKMAMTILSAGSVESILKFIDEGDVKGLSSLPKIGKKKAEQIILTLKGKLIIEDQNKTLSTFLSRDDICSALIHLGFKPNDVALVVDKMDSSIDLQTGVRIGLSALTQAQI